MIDENIPLPPKRKTKQAEPKAPAKKTAKLARIVPPCPPMSPYLGSKTPEVVAWYRVFQPEQAKQREAGRTGFDEEAITSIMALFEQK